MKHRWFLSAILVITLCSALLPSTCFAQNSKTPAGGIVYAKQLAAIEEKVEKRRQELGIPGMSLAIVKDGEIILIKGFGYKDLERKIPVTPDTQFAIGSITKSFTALSVLMSVDEGKLKLDDSPKKFLPYFRMKDIETDKNMTVRDLLDHSSGLNRTDLAMLTGKLTRRELIQTAGEAEPMAKLNEKFFYNNIMYSAAGEIVAGVQNQSWEAFIKNRIFMPLGMNNSTPSIAQMQKAKDYSLGYEYNAETGETVRFPVDLAFRPIDGVAAAGAITSSARDMTQWITFVMNRGVVNGTRLISEKNYEEWIKPQNKITPDGKMSYSLGWFLKEFDGLQGIGHGGNVPGFTSLAAMLPEAKIGFVMLTNVSASTFGNELTALIFELLLEKSAAQENRSAANTGREPGLVNDENAVGKYRFEQSRIDVEIQQKNGRLIAVIPGQPVYELELIGGRKYKIVNAPAGFFVTFNDASLLLEQPQGKFTLPKLKNAADSEQKPPPTPEIKAGAIMAKAVAVVGGETNLRRITSRVIVSEIAAVHQGIRGQTISYAKSPNKAAELTTLSALGKTIGKILTYYDGSGGQEISSFLPVEKFSGKRLADIRIEADFYNILNWQANYRSVEVTGIEKIGDEDCYIVELTPEKGTKTTHYYSTTSFLLLKKTGVIPSNSGQAESFTLTFSDYREVDGVRLPFKTVRTTASMGDIISVVKSVKHDAAIEDSIFAPGALPVD